MACELIGGVHRGSLEHQRTGREIDTTKEKE